MPSRTLGAIRTARMWLLIVRSLASLLPLPHSSEPRHQEGQSSMRHDFGDPRSSMMQMQRRISNRLGLTLDSCCLRAKLVAYRLRSGFILLQRSISRCIKLEPRQTVSIPIEGGFMNAVAWSRSLTCLPLGNGGWLWNLMFRETGHVWSAEQIELSDGVER